MEEARTPHAPMRPAAARVLNGAPKRPPLLPMVARLRNRDKNNKFAICEINLSSRGKQSHILWI